MRKTSPAFDAYFVGLDRLGSETNSMRFREVVALKESQAVEKLMEPGLSRSLLDCLKTGWPGLASSHSPSLDSLWTDLKHSEGRLTVFTREKQMDEWMLALRLKPERAALWSTNLWRIAATGTGAQASGTLAGFPGWALQMTNPAGTVRFTTVGNWSVIDWFRNRPAAADRLVQQLKTSDSLKAPSTNWLEIAFDRNLLPPNFFPGWLNGLLPDPSARGVLSVSGHGGYLRSRVKIQYDRDQKWQLEPWQIPTNIIMDPMVSFTALQGFGPWLASREKVRLLELNPPPNRAFVWALADTPFQTYAALPVQEGPDTLPHLAQRLPDFIRACFPPRGVGEVIMLTNQPVIQWSGLPFVIPYVSTAKAPSGQYLVGGLFPTVLTNTTPMPLELAAQVQGRTNLLFYDWEITQERLLQLQMLVPLLSLLSPEDLQSPAAAQPRGHQEIIAAWIKAMAPQLGNSVTEVVATSPREIQVVRKSHLGLSSVEIIALARWLNQLPPVAVPNPVKP